MVVTPSATLALGTPAPDFRLPDTKGNVVSRDDFREAPAQVVAFVSNHCPFVKHIREGFAKLARDYQARDVPVTGRDLRAALDAVLEGRAVSPDQRPSVGCNIKWKPGNEPE